MAAELPRSGTLPGQRKPCAGRPRNSSRPPLFERSGGERSHRADPVQRLTQQLTEGVPMKGGPQAAMALAFGYLLGRRRKLRMATMMAGGMAVGAVGGIGGMALKRGAKVLGNTEMLGKVSPQLTEIVDTVRNDLLDAGKAAAMAAVSGRIDSLTDTLHDRAESLRNPVDAATGEAGKAAGRAGKAAGSATGRLRRRGKRAEDDELADDEVTEAEDDEALDADEDEEEPRRRGDADAEDEYDDGYEAEDEADLADDDEAEEPGDEDEPVARPRRSRSSRTKSPVSRTRR